MKLHLYVLTTFLGVVLAVHLAMNGKVGSVLNNVRVGNALFWCIGAVGAAVIGITGWQRDALAPLKDVHPALLAAGVLGASLVFAIAWLIPQVGAGSVMITLLAGQVLEHMTGHPTPTRSEVCCLHDALLKGYRGRIVSSRHIGQRPRRSSRV